MTDIRLTPEQIIQVSKDLAKQATQIEAAAKAADGSVTQIRPMKSPRLERDIQQWDQLRRQIDQAVQALRHASDELNKLAQDNLAANR